MVPIDPRAYWLRRLDGNHSIYAIYLSHLDEFV